jgi:hypothetical protein
LQRYGTKKLNDLKDVIYDYIVTRIRFENLPTKGLKTILTLKEYQQLRRLESGREKMSKKAFLGELNSIIGGMRAALVEFEADAPEEFLTVIAKLEELQTSLLPQKSR